MPAFGETGGRPARSWGWLATLILSVGCASSQSLEPDAAMEVPPPDAAVRVEPPADRDSDDDRVCDSSEERYGTDPAQPDSDDDGYSDWAEIVFGFDPLRPSEPDRRHIFVLRESAAAEAYAGIEAAVRGNGEDFEGAFEPRDAIDKMGQTAADFFADATAVFAEPMDHVGAIDGEGFRQVVGRTLLGWELRFAFGGNAARQCARLYPFVYSVKRSDDRVVAAPLRYLLVLPPAVTLDSVEWCVPDGHECI